MSSLENNLKGILKEIQGVCDKQGRDYKEVTLVAVTKTLDVSRIKEGIDLGLLDIGENKAQEIMDKYDYIKDISNIHMIGHLQSNKVKYIIDKVKLIHSVERLSLVKEIDKRARIAGVTANVLIQVNIAEEVSKFGIKIEEVDNFIKEASKYKNILIKGLMTIAPHVQNPEDVRFVFRSLKEKFDSISSDEYENVSMEYLSMGMTNDYIIALEEGSNMLRIGTRLFGKRVN